MKKIALVTSYFAVLAIVFSLNSCQDDPITPNGNGGSNVDTTWVDDSTSWDPNGGGNNPYDSTYGGGGNPCDSTYGGGNTNPNDSTFWNPNDSINGGGGSNPSDSTGWNPSDSLGGN